MDFNAEYLTEREATCRRRKCWMFTALVMISVLVLFVFGILELSIPIASKIVLPEALENSTHIVQSYELSPHALAHRKGYEHNLHVRMMSAVQKHLNVTDCWLCTHLPQTAQHGIVTYSEPLPRDTTALALYRALWVQRRLEAEKFVIDVLTPLGMTDLVSAYFEKDNAIIASSQVPPMNVPFLTLIKPRSPGEQEHWTDCKASLHPEKLCPLPIPTRIVKTPVLCFIKAGSRQVGTTKNCPEKFSMSFDKSFLYVGPSVYFVCGNVAYLWLPKDWGGVCYLSLLLPDILPVFTKDLHLLLEHDDIPHTLARTKRFSSFDFMKGLIPMYGITENSRAIHELATLLDRTISTSTSALSKLSIELKATRLVALQNRLGLDIIFSKEGKLCQVIGTSCCSYIPSNTDSVEDSIKRLHVLATQVTAIEEATGPGGQTSWASGVWTEWGWKLLMIAFGILAIISLVCLGLHCLPILCSALLTPTTVPNPASTEMFAHPYNAQMIPTRDYVSVPGYGRLPSKLSCAPILEHAHLYVSSDPDVPGETSDVCFKLKPEMCGMPDN